MASPTRPDEFNQGQQQQQEAGLLAEGEEEPYNSEEDPDFDVNNPTATGAGEESEGSEVESESDAEGGEERDGEADARPRKRRKVAKVTGEQGGGQEDDFVMGDLESGDEVTIREGLERKMKKTKGKNGTSGSRNGEDEEEEVEGEDLDFEDDDEAGGEGGFVRTRGMKMRMQEERRPLVDADQSTIDVDALWAQMNAPTTVESKDEKSHGNKDAIIADVENAPPAAPTPQPGEETITIKRVYKFAGEVITEEKVVPKHSAEAQIYLASVEGANAAAKRKEDQHTTSSPPRTRRPLRRISRFDPNPPDAIKKNWEKQTGVSADGAPKGPKLNTVMKSRLDWAAYVDREGIKDELDVHSKAKDSYLNRTDFLDRTEARKEDEMRNMRLKNMG